MYGVYEVNTPVMEKQRKSEELANFMMENRVFGGVHVFFPQIQ